MGRKAKKKTVKNPSPSPEPDAVELSASEEGEVVQSTAGLLRRSPRKRTGHSSKSPLKKQKSSVSIPEKEGDSGADGGDAPPHAQQTKSKKEPVKFDHNQEETILDYLEVNECLWNPGHGEWMKGDVKEKAWNTIGAILQCDGIDVRTWWNTNKDRFVREHKKSKSGSGTKVLSAHMQWLMTHLSFYSKI